MQTIIKKNGGFTLVELIVVIAILAILAAVAVPAYNGYIEKANKAADEQLIAAINKAAAAAVLEANGKDISSMGNESLQTNLAQTVPDGGVSVWESTEKNGPLVESFAKYFAGNDPAVLKWYKGATFKNGAFVGYRNLLQNPLKDSYGAKEAYKDSSYANLGVEGLTGMVDSLAGALSDYPALNRVTKTGAFGKTLDMLGIDPETADEQTLANAAVFHVANYTGQLDQSKISDYVLTGAVDGKKADGTLIDGSLEQWLVSDENAHLGLTNDDAIFLGTAIKYAMATSYVYSGFAPDETVRDFEAINPTDRSSAMSAVKVAMDEDGGYWAYLVADSQTKNGADDLDAFYKIMQAITENSDSFVKYGGENFFSDPDMQAAMKEMLGEK